MPTYQYRCTSCGRDLEVVQKFSDATLTVCPTCQGALRKVFNAVGVVFKGSGFYRTDSRAAESNGGSKGDKGAEKKESGEKSETKADSGAGKDVKAGAGSSGSGGASNGGSAGSGSSTGGSSTGGPSNGGSSNGGSANGSAGSGSSSSSTGAKSSPN